MHRNHKHLAQQEISRQTCKQIDQSHPYTFFNMLTGPELLDTVETSLPLHRERLFPPTETLSMFMSQALSADRSCQNIVNTFAVQRRVAGLTVCSTDTGAYCKARQRLPLAMLQTLLPATGKLLSDQTPSSWRWRGRPVRLVDGTTLRMPDTPANQQAFPQPRTQKPGLGFPLCRLVTMVCLGSGALLNAAVGPYRGKGGDEQSLLRTLLSTLNTGDVLVGDAYYATYFLLCELNERGVDGVFEQHGARQRTTDFRLGHRLGTRDHLITLAKPKKKPHWMSQADFDLAPESLTVREIRVDGKTLVTTLVCPKQTPKAELKQLYRDRWHVELDLRCIKTTLGMDKLSCQSPEMNMKEIWVTLLAYNLIRLLMAQAAQMSGSRPREISFKHTLQLWIAWYQRGLAVDELVILLTLVAQQRVGNRPGRIEPRAVKQRPKPFPLLTKPRHIAQAEIRTHGHPQRA